MRPLGAGAQVDALAELYDRRAEAYDALWSPVIRPVGERLLKELPLSAARKVLDVGAGTGALLPAICRAAPRATVLGIDRSPGMLALARRRHSGQLAVMDAQRLDLPAHEFDVAVVAFMLFHLPDPRACLREVVRVLRLGGAIGTATRAREEAPAANAVWEEELSAAGASVIQLPATENEGSCDSIEKVAALLNEAGFTTARIWTEPVEHRWSASDHEKWHLAGKSGARLMSLRSGHREACLDRIRARLAALDGAHYRFQGEVVMTTATRPLLSER